MAFLLSISVFVFWSCVGLAVLTYLDTGVNLLRRFLLTPAVGAAAVVLPIFALNRVGMPVRNFGVPLTGAIIAGAAFLLWRARPAIPVRRLLPFFAVLLLALLITGYPLLLYGFNWVSYCNDDMANYVLAAHNFLDHGFNDVPDPRSVLDNTETSRTLWFMYAIGGVRPGSDLTLAWLISVTRLNGFQAYMPMMMALHLSLISCLGGLVLRSRGFRVAALTSCAWLALSPLNTLGTMYQLVAQVFGLTLLTASTTVLLQPFSAQSSKQRLRFAMLAGLLVAALVVVYTEITPFLVVAFGGFHALQIGRRKETLRSLLATLAVTIASIAMLVRSWGISAALFFIGQAGSALEARNLEMTIFPYYLIPSGLANLWGFSPIGGEAPLNAAIALGAALLATGLVFSAWQAWIGEPVAVMSAVMLVVAANLFVGNVDFGLFKLAMYIQPFLLSSIVLGWLQFSQRWTCGRD